MLTREYVCVKHLLGAAESEEAYGHSLGIDTPRYYTISIGLFTLSRYPTILYYT